MEFVVSPQEHGLSLLGFLTQKNKETLSIKKIKKAIDAKACRVNGKVEFFSSYLLREGDKVTVNSSFFQEKAVLVSEMAILFEDAYFVIVDKKPGIICDQNLFKEKKWILIHRLDKDTSGALLVAKSKESEEAAKALFHKREIQKTYLALVDGPMKGKKGIIENYLGKKREYQGQTIYGEVSSQDKGVKAITHWAFLAGNEKASLVLCDLKTGRTHQIRVHLSEKGCPILGDYQYATKPPISGINPARHLLHAWKLCFVHPFTQQKIEVESSIPFDFLTALKHLNIKNCNLN